MFSLAGCTWSPNVHDPHRERSQKKTHDLLTEVAQRFLPSPPEILAYDQEESAALPLPAFQKRVTVRIDESMDITAVLKTLAQKVGVSLVLDRDIDGALYYQAQRRPFIEVVDHICAINQLVYHFENHVLKIERDRPHFKTYSIRFLNQSRKTDNVVAINNTILSQTTGTASSNNGSSSTVSSTVTMDFWEELERSLRNILQLSKEQNAKEEEEEENKKDDYKLLIKNLSEDERKLFQNNSLSKKEMTRKKLKRRYAFAVHRQAGLISVYGTSVQHASVQNFLEQLKRQTSTQILIEAKIVEVTLKEEFKSGIDWQKLSHFGAKGSGRGTGDFSFKAFFGSVADAPPSVISVPETREMIRVGGEGKSLTSILHFMESFGTVRTLSSPRLTVLNNQTALMKVAENFVYFTVTGTLQFMNTTPSQYGTLVTTSSTPHSVPIGFIMNVQPSIDDETREVIINLRPTISRLISIKPDPGVEILNQSLQNPSQHIQSGLPVVAVREIDSVLRMTSGAVAVLGGLMIEGAELGGAGIPGTIDTPIGFLTSAKRQARAVTELVIFLKATILDDSRTSVTPADQRLYANFTTDPRPLNMKGIP